MLRRIRKKDKLRAIITQNIDTLHEQAGSKNVLKLHGTVDSNYCVNCCKHYTLKEFLMQERTVPKCVECGGVIKPYVTLYEEELDMNVFNSAIRYIKQADVLIVGGTSLSVYPAANLIRYFKGKYLIVINKTPTPHDSIADLVINGKIGEVFSKIDLN